MKNVKHKEILKAMMEGRNGITQNAIKIIKTSATIDALGQENNMLKVLKENNSHFKFHIQLHHIKKKRKTK